MIKIDRSRSECPKLLREGSRWDSQNCHAEIVEALHIMQHGKCCYCEKKISTSGNEQSIEHYKPKAPNKFPELENTWENLLHACADCNGKKGQRFPTDENDDPLIIDPSSGGDIDPEEHLKFDVDDNDELTFGRISARNNSQYGENTIRYIDLDLAKRRRDRTEPFNKLYSAYLEIVTATDEITKTQKVRAFEGLLGANNKYAAFAREFARFKKLDSRFGVRIPRGAEV